MSTTCKVVVLAALFALALGTASAGSIVLEFDMPVPGTIQDQSGLGTGLSHRLPGTGGALPINAPNLDLASFPGSLLLTSSDSDINGARNIDVLDAVGFFLPGVGTDDLSVRASVKAVAVPNPSDQLMLYAATSSGSIIRAGFHDGYVYHLTSNQGFGDSIDFSTGPTAFSPGDDVEITLARIAGLWRISWNNSSNPSASGISFPLSYTWLDSAADLYVGILASNARSTIPFTSQIEMLSVTTATVPEPSVVVLAATGAVLLLLTRSGRAMLRTRGGP